MPPYSIRLLGDPVLKQKATDIDDVDGALVRLADDMVLTLNEAAGLGLAAPQVGRAAGSHFTPGAAGTHFTPSAIK